MAQPQQARSIKTRRTILEAAGALFGAIGYAATTTEMIIERSGVPRGTMYFHFPSKEAVADAIVAAEADVIVPPVRRLKLQSLIALTYRYADVLMHDPVLQGLVRLSVDRVQPSHGEPWRTAHRSLTELIRAAAENGELLPSVEPERFATVLQSAFTGVQLSSQVSTNRKDLPERVTDMWRYLLPGVAIPGLLPSLSLPDLPD
ncbi:MULTISPECIES: ScbR family autoregulator-binding transcription factor [Streptomycetaceae]|uniref:FarA n=1 Tax=Streptantibioticus cattleyicolor (strain ATCC 35852 / DSM 46488 / JCM 4925 / NBRC 14057 / NRRL 8057) TaxID=1003195 RepID=F8K328_STREN|nr:MULTISPECIES: ScbR family autoregulator-binding transcription factor [Streptomycetaceae]AEW92523.1 FarA [Streptantibioticus cattleyicolor NRRL 8057 = DSM 46488]MYS57320.1 TetR family transcriptional regulator [Streptomyces sp. SID5468]CCB72883.1 FarA [Streptantibioticus cattleyicolor NRRL 8057 = DSM 46488]